MNKQEAEKIIQDFEEKDPTEMVSRGEVIDVMTAMNVFTLHQISNFIMQDYLDNMVHKLRET